MLPPTRAKRTSDNSCSKPTKRPRTNGDANHDYVLLDSSPEQHDTPRSANGAVQRRKDRRDVQSQRSSGERQGSEVNEFRATTKHAGIGRGKSRNRHKKDSGPNRHAGGDRGTANLQQKPPSSIFLKPRMLLSRQPEVSNDRISDDDEDADADVATLLPQPRQPNVNGRGTAQYTQAVFKVPGGSSEDELSQSQPKTKLRDAMIAGGTTRRGFQNINGTKRSASSPDELRVLQAKKRRADSTGEGDVPRMESKFAFSVKRAVCDKCFIYPAADSMLDGATGATTKPCSLVMSTQGDSKHFRTIDSQQEKELDELDWITPNLSKVTKIDWNGNCPIVRMYKSPDIMAKFPTGANLIIEFGSPDEASTYVRLCQKKNRGIESRELAADG